MVSEITVRQDLSADELKQIISDKKDDLRKDLFADETEVKAMYSKQEIQKMFNLSETTLGQIENDRWINRTRAQGVRGKILYSRSEVINYQVRLFLVDMGVDEEIAKGVPLTFYVREMVRPSGRLEKEYYDPNGVKYRSIVQIMKN